MLWALPYRPRSMRGQLVGLLLGLAVPLIAVQAWWGYRELRSAEEAAGTHAVVYANTTAAGVRQFLDQAERLLRAGVDRRGLSLLESAGCQVAVQELTETSSLANVFVVDGTGGVVCSEMTAPPGTSAGDWEWFSALESGTRFALGSPVAGTLSNTWVLPLVTSIVDDEGDFRGAVVASLPLLSFTGLIPGALGLGDERVVTITDARDIVIADSRDPADVVGRPSHLFDAPMNQIGPRAWVASAPDANGVTRMWGRTVMENGWSVYVGVPSSTILAPARAAAVQDLMVTLIILLIVVGVATLGYRRIAASLTHLASGLRTTDSEGIVEPPPNTPTEVRTIVNRFNETLRARGAAEAAERAARDRYKAIFENAVFGIYVATEDARFLEINPALVRMLQYDSVEALLEAGPGALWPAGEIGFRAFHAELGEGEGEGLETILLRADLTPVTVRVSGRVTSGSGGERTYEMIVQDITEVRQKEHELRQTQKMDAIGKLAGGIAHDFNNLLVVIGGNVELMGATLPPGHSSHGELEQVREAVDRASALTAQLLAFSRKERPKPTALHLNAVLTNMERMLVRLIGPDIELQTRLSGADPCVSMDRSELEQVVMNLVLNARDAITVEGSIVVETRLEARELENGDSVDGVVLSVRDTGRGMEAATLAHIFEPFYTTKPVGQGTGLGLSTVYGIVLQAGGLATAESEPGSGTVIDIWLPTLEETGDAGSEATDDAANTAGSETILVAEDEELVRVFVERALVAAGYDVLLAADGQEALELFEERGDTIDLVLTDVVMPRMKGPTLGRKLASISPGLPVLYMSGYLDPHATDAEFGEGADHLIHKPFRSADLLARIRKALDGEQVPNEA